jgi:hypothetical protein
MISIKWAFWEKARKNSYATSGMLRKNKNNIGLLENPIKIIRAYF